MVKMPTRFGLVLVALLVATGGSAAGGRPTSAELIDLLAKSTRHVTEGGDDCKGLAEFHSTLGALVKYFGRQANGRKRAWCARLKGNAAALSCSAEFANKVPSERSDEEFLLRVDFQFERGTIGAFTCYLAG